MRKYSKNQYPLYEVIELFARDKIKTARRFSEANNDYVYLATCAEEGGEGFKLAKTMDVENPDDYLQQMGAQGFTKIDFEAEWFVEWSPKYAVHDELVVVFQNLTTGRISAFPQSGQTIEQAKSKYSRHRILYVHSVDQTTGELETLWVSKTVGGN